MACGLAMVWAHPHQAHFSSLDEAVRKLTLLIDIGNNWVYAFVQLNEEALHVPLSNEGHISVMIDGVVPSRSTCRHLHKLEVCKLLQCGDQVVCPNGMNGGLEPVLLSLPKLPIWNMDTLSRPVHKPLLLQVDLSHVMHGDQMPITPGPCRASTPHSSSCLAMECPSETANCTSMAAKLQELFILAGAGHLQPSLRGHYPKETNISSPGCSTIHWSRRSTGAREASFGHTQAGGYLPAGINMSSYTWWYHPNQPFALSNPGIKNSWGSQCPYCPKIWDSSWYRLECPLWWSTLTTRGDEQGHGVTTYNQGIHRHLLQEAGIGHQNCLPSKQGPNHQSH